MDSWVSDIQFERHGPLKRLAKAVLINPLANYLPAGWLKELLRFSKSELAASNWSDPGGWRSMVISYHGQPKQIADRVLAGAGTMAMALRNRKRLGARLIARLIEEADSNPVHALCLGAGPGQIITEAMSQARRPCLATLVDLSNDAFEYGRELARSKGLSDRVRFVQGDVREVRQMLDDPPDLVKMIGICEYLTDEQIVHVAGAVAEVMPPRAPIVYNSISKVHGTDRFFRRVFGLHMIHRSPKELERLMGQGGFEDFVAHREPLGVYHVIIGRKRR